LEDIQENNDGSLNKKIYKKPVYSDRTFSIIFDEAGRYVQLFRSNFVHMYWVDGYRLDRIEIQSAKNANPES